MSKIPGSGLKMNGRNVPTSWLINAAIGAIGLLIVIFLILHGRHSEPQTKAAGITVNPAAYNLITMSVAKAPLALPTVMANPPKVTLSATSGIPNGTLKSIIGPEFQNYGHRLGPNSSGPWFLGVSSTPNLIVPQPAAANATPYSMEWTFDGSVFEIHLSGNGASYRLLVDGQYTTPTEQAIAATDFGAYYLKVDFGSRAIRKIRLETANNLGLDGVVIGPGDNIWRPAEPKGPRVIVFGDSVVEGQTGSVNILDSFVHQLGWLMGWNDIWASGSGGTGYVSPGSPNTKRVKLLDRLQSDVIRYKPDIVIVEAGFNDTTYPKDQVQQEATQLFSALRRGLPAAKIIAVGPWYASSQVTDDQVKTRDAVKAAATENTDAFIDIMSGQTFVHGQATAKEAGGWITGTGAAGAPAMNGNADIYIASDHAHPSVAGHTYYAERLAAILVDLLS